MQSAVMNVDFDSASGDSIDNRSHSAQANESLAISVAEFAFSLLIDSYEVAFKPLNDLIIAAVKANNSDDWLEKTCSSFTVSVKQHVREGLENGCTLKDIFVVCKVIRSRLNDVSLYVGGSLLDPREKERLSLEAQGVEVARHRAFHGEFISPLEVHSSLNLLISILTCLPCGQEKMERLQSLFKELERALTSEPSNQRFLPSTTLWKILLYRSLGEFEKGFLEYLKKQEKNAIKDVPDDLKTSRHFEEKNYSSFQHLIKTILKQLSAPKKERKMISENMDKNVRVSCTVRCKNIASMRNKFAHNEHLTKEDVVGALQDINEILTVFGLTCKQTKSALTSINYMEENGEKYCCVVSQIFDCSEAFLRHHVLRSGVVDFVGRNPELALINEHLISHSQSEPYQSTAVILFGCAGIGKSFLANKIICDLRETYPKQKWLCCSGEEELKRNSILGLEEIHASLNKHISKGEPSATSAGGSNVASLRSNLNRWLYVLDDVSSQSVLTVLNMLLTSPHCFVLTTRSTAVKDILLKHLGTVLVVPLHPFTVSESSELIERKTRSRLTEHDLVQASETVQHVFGNLPLCVSIFSSLQAASSKRERNTGLRDSVNGSLSFIDWEEIEKDFTDKHHVRGLSGILQIASSFLENRPLPLFLLAKIVLYMTEKIPWQEVKWLGTQSLPGAFVSIDDVLCDLFGRLKGILDWLFSLEGEEVLIYCRETLEELGLITWKKQKAQVCIHDLTLKGVRSMLYQKRLFFGKLLSFSLPDKQFKDGQMRLAVDSFYNNFQSSVMWQIISSHIEYLGNATISCVERTPSHTEKLMLSRVYSFLADLLDTKAFEQVAMGTTSGKSRALLISTVKSTTCSCLFDFVIAMRWNDCRKCNWLNLYEAFPLSQMKLEDMLLTYNAHIAAQFPGRTETSESEEVSISNFIACGRLHRPREFYWHCRLAVLKQYNRGREERKLYLREASKMCPRLLTEPNMNGMRDELVKIRQIRRVVPPSHGSFMGTQIHENLVCWHILLLFRIGDQTANGLATNGKVDKTTGEQRLALIELLQEMQKICMDISKAEYGFEETDRDMSAIGKSFTLFQAYSSKEASIWAISGNTGKALGVTVRSINKAIIDFRLGHLTESNVIQREVFFDILEEIVYFYLLYLFICTQLVFHPWLGKELSELLHPFFERSRYYLVRRSHPKEHQTRLPKFETNYGDIEYYLRAGDILYFRGHFMFYSNFDVEQSLRACVLSLEYQAHAYNTPNPHNIFSKYLTQCSSLIPRLCALLGGRTSHQVCREIEALSETNHSSIYDDIIKQLISNIKDVSQDSDAENIYKTFCQTLRYLRQEDLSQARRTALCCWRNLASLRYSAFTGDEYGHGVQIIEQMFLSLADTLRLIYASEREFEIVKWFCLYLLDTATIPGKRFLVVKYQSFFIDYLRQTQQLSKALEQARLLQIHLTEEFGQDYLDWLTDAPNAAALCEDLQKEISVK